jgi:glycosyltransferase involved in cell wall biosynthesis
MASIRVYLLTCRRSNLLRRALQSLLAQTCIDWVCELHNDAPEDDSPEHVLSELAPGDKRFTYHRHSPTWGAVSSFNHCFRAGPEPYATLLEDDNWWEPQLLATLLSAIAAQPAVVLAWANMRVWRESETGSWVDTGETVWPSGTAVRFFDWPVILQAFEGLHSNGAMIFRRPASTLGAVPESTPFAIIEPVRERGLSGRLMLVDQVLANYALTQRTARSGDRALWAEGQLLLAASFFQEVPLTAAAWDELLTRCREARPRRTSILLLLALAGVRRREILSRIRPGDLVRFARDFSSSLRINLRALRFRDTHNQLWTWLRAETAARTTEAHRAGQTALDVGTLFTKHTSGAI